MNGVTGRMGYRQHLVRSVLAIRDEGGIELPDGSRLQVEPVLIGRRMDKLARAGRAPRGRRLHHRPRRRAGRRHGHVYFDSQITGERKKAILKAVAAGKHVFTEKPIAESVEEGQELVDAAREAGIIDGVVHDKLYLPGLLKLKRLVDAGFFGEILSVRGEFGYWVFEGDIVPAQRPSWNYRAEDGGGMVLDMFCHWNYVLENLFGRVRSVTAKAVTHIPQRWDEQGRPYQATADDAAYGIFELEGGIIAQINSSWAVRVDRASWWSSRSTAPTGRPWRGCSAAACSTGCRRRSRSGTPTCPTDQDFRSQWDDVPDNEVFRNGFRAQWERYLLDVHAGRPHLYDFAAGVRGLQLVEAGLRSSAEGRTIQLQELAVTELLGTALRIPTADGWRECRPARAAGVGGASRRLREQDRLRRRARGGRPAG